MVQSVVIIGSEEVQSLLNALPDHLFDRAKKAIGVSTLAVHTRVSDFSGGSNRLNSRTGLLRRSLKAKIEGSKLNSLRGSVSTGVKYAPIHETGGTIRAKDKYLRVPGGPYLNIPLDANKTAAGVMRRNAGAVFGAGGYIIKSKRANYIVMSNQGVPMFVLVKQVTLKARLGMVDAMEDEVPTLLGSLQRLLLVGI